MLNKLILYLSCAVAFGCKTTEPTSEDAYIGKYRSQQEGGYYHVELMSNGMFSYSHTVGLMQFAVIGTYSTHENKIKLTISNPCRKSYVQSLPSQQDLGFIKSYYCEEQDEIGEPFYRFFRNGTLLEDTLAIVAVDALDYGKGLPIPIGTDSLCVSMVGCQTYCVSYRSGSSLNVYLAPTRTLDDTDILDKGMSSIKDRLLLSNGVTLRRYSHQ